MISMLLSEAATSMNAKLTGENIRFTGCSTDTRMVEQGNLFIALRGENFDGHDFVAEAEMQGAVASLTEQSQSHEKPLLTVENTRKAMGLLAKKWREQMAIPLIAVTGSNGKTTVKEMVSCILKQTAKVHATKGNLNNDIGVPLTLLGMSEQDEYAVVEMGANHLGEIEWLSSIARPDVAVITQCAPSHLEGFGSVAGVAKAKAEIYSGLSATGIAVINADDDYAAYWRTMCKQLKQFSFGIKDDAVDVTAKNIVSLPEHNAIEFELCFLEESMTVCLPLFGEHNVMNALAAAACCLSLQIPIAVIKAGLEKLSPVNGRLQIKKGKHGSRIIDDTYNANPKSLAAAMNVLSQYSGTRYLVLGDMGELGDAAVEHHLAAGKMARLAGIDALFCLGELSLNAKESFGQGARHFTSYEALEGFLLTLLKKDSSFLIKGSRYMQMDHIVNSLIEEKM